MGKFFKVLGLVLLVVVITVVSIRFYSKWKSAWGKEKTTSLCDSAVVGGSFQGLREKGMELGLTVTITPKMDPDCAKMPEVVKDNCIANPTKPGDMILEASEGMIFHRWRCYIYISGSLVTGKRVVDPTSRTPVH